MKWPLKHAATIAIAATMMWAGSALAQTTDQPSPAAQSDAPPPPPGGRPPRGGPGHRIEMLQHELNLTPDQTTQVRALLETERSKAEAVRSNSALSADDRRSQMMAIHQDTNTKMHTLLTPDQVTKYDAMEARMRERRGPAGGPPPPPPSGPGQL